MPTVPTKSIDVIPYEVQADGLVLRGLRYDHPFIKNGPVIVAVHGWLDNCYSFIPMLPYLDAARVYLLDLPGHGQSDHYSQGRLYHFLDYIPVYLKALQSLHKEDARPLVLMGHSLGAAVSSFSASALCGLDKSMRAERGLPALEGLVLLDGIGPLSNPQSEAFDKFAAFLKHQHKETASEHTWHLPTRRFDDVDKMVRARMRVGGLPEKAARLLVERNLSEAAEGDSAGQNNSTGRLRWSYDNRLKIPSPFRLTEKQVRHFFKEVTCKTLLVQTGDLPAVFKKKAEKRAKAFKKLTHVKLKGGHHLHMEKPKKVARAVNKYLDKL